MEDTNSNIKKNYVISKMLMRLNNTLLNEQWIIKEIWEKIKNSYNQMTVQYIILSYTAKAVLGEKFIDVELILEN